MDLNDQGNNIEGFTRRPRRPPQHIEIVVISSDDEDDVPPNRLPNRTSNPPTIQIAPPEILKQFELEDLEIKREAILSELDIVSDDETIPFPNELHPLSSQNNPPNSDNIASNGLNRASANQHEKLNMQNKQRHPNNRPWSLNGTYLPSENQINAYNEGSTSPESGIAEQNFSDSEYSLDLSLPAIYSYEASARNSSSTIDRSRQSQSIDNSRQGTSQQYSSNTTHVASQNSAPQRLASTSNDVDRRNVEKEEISNSASTKEEKNRTTNRDKERRAKNNTTVQHKVQSKKQKEAQSHGSKCAKRRASTQMSGNGKKSKSIGISIKRERKSDRLSMSTVSSVESFNTEMNLDDVSKECSTEQPRNRLRLSTSSVISQSFSMDFGEGPSGIQTEHSRILHRLSTSTVSSQSIAHKNSMESEDSMDSNFSTETVNAGEYFKSCNFKTDGEKDFASNFPIEREHSNASELGTQFGNEHASKSRDTQNNSSNQFDADMEIEQDCDDDNQLLIPAPTPASLRNIDKDMYFGSEKAKCCIFCKKILRCREVSHYKSTHEDEEVFISRISPQIVDTIEQENRSFIKFRKGHSKMLRALCIFCGMDKNFSPYYWIEDIRGHTGEYVNECLLCEKKCHTHIHHGVPTHSKETFDLNVRDFIGYRCTHCNYVQLERDQIESHLVKQHGYDEVSEDFMSEFMILPSLNRLPLKCDPNDVLVEVQVGPKVISPFIDPQPSTSWAPFVSIPMDPQPSTSWASTPKICVLENRIIYPASTSTKTEFSTSEHQLNDTCPANDMKNVVEINSIKSAKFDPEEADKLLKIAENYKKIETYKTVVRPYIDGDYHRKPSINLLTQFSLYKCMYEKCIFATNSTAGWQKHMQAHCDLIDAFIVKKLKLSKERRDDLKRFRECCYCDRESKTNFETNRHISEEHSRSIFQCAHCFYRTIEVDNLVLHYETFHVGSSKEILLCGDQRDFEEKDEEVLKQCLALNVTKIVCGQDNCKDEFGCLYSLDLHLQVNHNIELQKYTCPYCYTAMAYSKSGIKKHFDVHTSLHFKKFQCLYCEEEAHDVEYIRRHMSEKHPTNFLYIGQRTSPKPFNDTDEVQIVYIGDSCDYSQYNLFKCADMDALNSMDPTELDPVKLIELNLSKMSNPNLKIPYKGKIPPISYPQTAEFISKYTIKYQDLQNELNARKVSPLKIKINKPKHRQKTISNRYKCMNMEWVSDLIKPYGTYKSRLCVSDECEDFVKIESKTGLKPYVDHLTAQHSCGAQYEFLDFQKMLNHRITQRAKDPIVYLQIEESQHLVYKIVQCEFQCMICYECFNTRQNIIDHHSIKHEDSFLDAQIIQSFTVVESIDLHQPVYTKGQTRDFVSVNLFKCNKVHSDIKAGFLPRTKKQALHHHNKFHLNEDFEVTATKLFLFADTDAVQIERYREENDTAKSHRLYVFQCRNCPNLFDSIESVEDHKCDVNFTMSKLVSCPEDEVIRTFKAMQTHYEEKHPDKICTSTNLLSTRYCGLCSFKCMSSSELKPHYRCKHETGESFDDDHLTSFNLEGVSVGECRFIAGCCLNECFKNPLQIINHLSNCSYRLKCYECPETDFNGLIPFVTHLKGHEMSEEEIVARLHNYKTLFDFLANMTVKFPNGLSVTLTAILNTDFGRKVRIQLSNGIKHLFEKERPYISVY